jgi:hypothetical protein
MQGKKITLIYKNEFLPPRLGVSAFQNVFPLSPFPFDLRPLLCQNYLSGFSTITAEPSR